MTMQDQVDSLLIDVRASTQGFAQDIQAMRGTFDTTLVDGFARGGNVLERSLMSAVRKGSLSFADLRRTAIAVIDDIAGQAMRSLFSGQGGSLFAGLSVGGPAAGGGGLLGGLAGAGVGLIGSLLGLPGRATGGPVSPGRGYLVGERGPELFVPTSAGNVAGLADRRSGRDVRVSINIVSPAGTSAPHALQRSSRQVASAVRRALSAN